MGHFISFHGALICFLKAKHAHVDVNLGEAYNKECPEELDPYKSFVVHTPMAPLSRTNTSALALEFCSWLFLWLGTFGRRFLVTGKLINVFS